MAEKLPESILESSEVGGPKGSLSFSDAAAMDLIIIAMNSISIMRRMAVLLRKENRLFVEEIEADIENLQKRIDSMVDAVLPKAPESEKNV